MKVVIRADGSDLMGMGHISRCLTLAGEIKRRGGDCLFVTRSMDGRVPAMIKKAGFPAREITAGDTASGDLDVTIKAAKRAGVIITDGYQFKEDYLASLKASGKLLVCIDDIAHTRFPCDILLNQNLGAAKKMYTGLVDSSARLLLGTGYALVREEFVDSRRKKPRTRRRIRNVLVSLGGGDSAMLTLKVLRALDSLDGDFALTAVFGSRSKGAVEAAETFLSDCSKNTEVIFYATDMPGLMHNADMAITGGGTTCWEAACVGLPNLLMVLAENQNIVARGLSKAGASVNLGWHEGITEARIAREARRLAEDAGKRDEMRKNGRTLVDGKGAARVAIAMEELFNERVLGEPGFKI